MLWRIAVTTITEQLLVGFSFRPPLDLLMQGKRCFHSPTPLHYRACPSMGLIKPFLCNGGWMLHRCQEVGAKRISTVSQEPAITKATFLSHLANCRIGPCKRVMWASRPFCHNVSEHSLVITILEHAGRIGLPANVGSFPLGLNPGIRVPSMMPITLGMLSIS